MCKNCWNENGSLSIVNEKTITAAQLIDTVFEFSLVGGYAHVVIDDWNLDEGCIEVSLASARAGDMSEHIEEECRQACIACLEYLKTLSEEERYSAMAIHSGFIDGIIEQPEIDI